MKKLKALAQSKPKPALDEPTKSDKEKMELLSRLKDLEEFIAKRDDEHHREAIFSPHFKAHTNTGEI